MRGYKKLDGLYDLLLKAASVNHNDQGVQTSVEFAGVSFDNAMRFTRHYIEALK